LIAKAFAAVGPPGVISNNACCPGLPARVASIFKLNCDVTGEVLIVKLARVAPAGTVTLWHLDEGGHGGLLLGRVAGALSMMETCTTVAALCGALKVTVPVAELPPATLVGLTARSASTGGGGAARTVSTSLKLYRPSERVTVTSVSVVVEFVSKNN
jgi:hypothetical protein